MEKVITFLSRPISRMWMLMLAAVLCSLTAVAGPTVDVGAITLGEAFKVPSTGVVTGTFTAPKSGTVTVTGVAAHGIEVCTDEAMTQPVEITTTTMYYPYTDDFEAEAGKTYYVRITEQWWMELTVTFTMAGVGETPLQIVDMYPAEGSVYDLASDGVADLQFTFNQPVQCGQGYYIMYKDPTAPETIPEESRWVTKNYPSGVVLVNGTLVSVVGVQANLIALMNQRHFENTEIRVVLNSLKTSSGQTLEDGKFMNGNTDYTYFNFKVGKLPITLTSSTVPSPFLSYWLPGNDAAKFEVVFSDNVSPNFGTELKVCYGNPEIDYGYYEESVPLTFDGNKITADLAGKLRTPATMLPVTLGSYSNINLRLGRVCDEAGGSVVGNSAGSPGTFVWTVPYTVIERANVAFEFTPGTGASLQNTEDVELWINSLNTIAFTGFKFEYSDAKYNEATVVVPLAEATFEQGDSDDEGIYTIPVPAECKAAKGVILTLDGLTSNDGYDHFGEVKAVYGKMAITSVTPANASSIAVLTAGTIITVETTTAAAYPEMVMVYEIEELNPEDPDEAIIKAESYMYRNEDGSYSSEVFGNYTLYTGHQYKVTFTAWANEDEKNYGESLGSDYIVWNGATAPYTYSTVEFLGITPAESTVLGPNDRTFTVKFSKVVTIDEADAVINVGMGQSISFESVVAVDPDTRFVDKTFAKEWVLTVPESHMLSLEAQLEFSFSAYDENDVLLKGNFGKDGNSRFYFSYEYVGRYADFNVEWVDGQFVASHESGLMPSYTMPASAAYVMAKTTREVVANVAELKAPIDDMDWDEAADYVNTEVYMILDKELPLNEAYVLYIPASYFNVGTEMSQKNSAEKYYSFVAEGPVEPVELNITTDPEQGIVTSLETIKVTFDDYDEIGLGEGKISLYCGKQWIKDLDDPELDWDIFNLAIINLGETYTDPGAYTLFVPEGLFLYGIEGLPVPAFTLTYIIEDNGSEEPIELNITTDPEQGTVASLETIKVTFEDYDEIGLGEGKISLYCGKQWIKDLDDPELDWDILNLAIINLGETYTEPGAYTLFVPEGLFLFGSEGLPVPAFTLTYIIEDNGSEEPVEVNYTTNPEEGVVKLLGDIHIWFTDYETVGNGEGVATLTIGENEPIELVEAEYGEDWNEMVQGLGTEYTEVGTYVINFPAGYFELGTGDKSPAITLTYTINIATGVENVTVNADGKVMVFDLKGVLRVSGDKEQLKDLPAGVYIVNGKKVLVK